MSQMFIRDNSSSGADIETVTGDSGGAVGPDGSFNLNVRGSGGVTVTGNPGTNTLTISVSGTGLTWNVLVPSSATMVSNNGYITTNTSLTSLALPATSAVGDYLTVIGSSIGGWTVTQGVGQQIRIGSAISTAGAGGSVSSFGSYDSFDLVCQVANTLWIADGAPESAGLTVV